LDRTENFLDRPLNESDWWEDDADDDDDSSSSADDDDESTASLSSFSSQGASSVPTPTSSTDSTTPAEQHRTNIEKNKQRFCNRGLQTWNRGRQVWREQGRRQFDAKTMKAKPIPASFQKELVKCLADRRQFELSQQIPLRDMIEAYTVVWASGAEK